MAKSNQPSATFKLGLVRATVWDNDGYFSVVLSRAYKDDSGNWKETDGLSPADLQSARYVLQQACDYVVSK
jgi:hypothetical protein